MGEIFLSVDFISLLFSKGHPNVRTLQDKP